MPGVEQSGAWGLVVDAVVRVSALHKHLVLGAEMDNDSSEGIVNVPIPPFFLLRHCRKQLLAEGGEAHHFGKRRARPRAIFSDPIQGVPGDVQRHSFSSVDIDGNRAACLVKPIVLLLAAVDRGRELCLSWTRCRELPARSRILDALAHELECTERFLTEILLRRSNIVQAALEDFCGNLAVV